MKRTMAANIQHRSRKAPLRAPILALLLLAALSCNATPTDTQPLDREAIPGTPVASLLATPYGGGIPFGLFALPTAQFGAIYNGAVRNGPILVETGTFLSTLAAIKSRGGKVSSS
jgi:hypothetical protein